MDRRKKRTSTNQYMMYIDLMEKDNIFATGRLPRDVDGNYLQKKWKELSDKLNTCTSGPTLTPDEWRKRLNDWKNTTRCKYRRSLSGEKDISMTTLEMKALDLFGKAPNSSAETLSIHLKSEKEEPEEELENHRASESFQKELQAAVEEAIGGDDDEDVMGEDHEDQDDVMASDPLGNHSQNNIAGVNNSNTSGTSTQATFRTIVVDTPYTDDDNNDDHVEYITPRRHNIVSTGSASNTSTTLGTSGQTGSTTVTKLINGDIPLKRLRTAGGPDQVIYEVKKAPQSHNQRTVTLHNNVSSGTVSLGGHHQTQVIHQAGDHTGNIFHSADAREIARQLKRLAEIKAEKLKFDIARFKFNNPGFEYNYPPL